MAANIRYANLEDRSRKVGDGMCEITLSCGEFACLVDEADVAALVGRRWWAVHKRKDVYAYGYVNGKQIPMHRWIMGLPELFVDHINGNTLDNRRCNLRLVSQSQNYTNRSLAHGLLKPKKDGLHISFAKRKSFLLGLLLVGSHLLRTPNWLANTAKRNSTVSTQGS